MRLAPWFPPAALLLIAGAAVAHGDTIAGVNDRGIFYAVPVTIAGQVSLQNLRVIEVYGSYPSVFRIKNVPYVNLSVTCQDGSAISGEFPAYNSSAGQPENQVNIFMPIVKTTTSCTVQTENKKYSCPFQVGTDGNGSENRGGQKCPAPVSPFSKTSGVVTFPGR